MHHLCVFSCLHVHVHVPACIRGWVSEQADMGVDGGVQACAFLCMLSNDTIRRTLRIFQTVANFHSKYLVCE